MSLNIRQLLIHTAVAALAAHAAVDTASAAVARSPNAVACVVRDIWANDAPKFEGAYALNEQHNPGIGQSPLESTFRGVPYQSGSGRAANRWTVKYRGDGVSRLRGAERLRVLRYGVLWTVNPSQIGATSRATIRALLNSGAAIARADSDGSVYFRATKDKAHLIAENALTALRRGQPDLNGAKAFGGPITPIGGGGIAGNVAPSVAMLRVEGRYSRSPLQFIDQMPGGMTIVQFGTSFVVHVRASAVAEVRDYIEQEGKSVLLVGAQGPAAIGNEIGRTIRYCGGNSLANRFPTPVVTAKDSLGIRLDVEGQGLRVEVGETILVVQRPLYGSGLEIAVVRV